MNPAPRDQPGEGMNVNSMALRILRSDGRGPATPIEHLPPTPPSAGWVWLDIRVGGDDTTELMAVSEKLRLDALAVRDAVEDADLPKVDDFGHHLLVVLHELRDDEIGTYPLHCFLTERHLLTVRREHSPSLDALWEQLQNRPELASGGPDELLARLADVLNRRLLSVLEPCEDHLDDLLERAVGAEDTLLGELAGVRRSLAQIRRVIHPQREALDDLRTSTSGLITDAGRRRLSDVFDVAARVGSELESARTAMAEILEAYRGAEARRATAATLVFTVYAAIMLPLALVAGYFGMNFDNLPGLRTDWGWVAVTGGLVAIAAVSLGVFIKLEWIRRPSGRKEGMTLGRALTEAARAPTQVAGAAFEISTLPLRTTTGRVSRRPMDAQEMDPQGQDTGMR